MKRQMIWIMIIFILTAALAEATVEDSGMAPGEVSSSPWDWFHIALVAGISTQPMFG